jgi:hypothetical protein
VFSSRMLAEWSAEIVAETQRRGLDNPLELIKALVREGLDRAAADNAHDTRTIETLSNRRASGRHPRGAPRYGQSARLPVRPRRRPAILTKGRISPELREAAIARIAERMGGQSTRFAPTSAAEQTKHPIESRLRENGRRYREFMANLPDDEKTALAARAADAAARLAADNHEEDRR